MDALPIGGEIVAPLSLVGEFLFVDFIKFDSLPMLFLPLQIILHYGRRYQPLLPDLKTVVSVICILSYLVRLYVSFPTATFK